MKPINELKVEKMPKDLRTPLFVVSGVLLGNYATNTLLPKAVNVSGLRGFLGAEMTENAQSILKVALPTVIGIGGYQLVDNKDIKNISIGIAGSGIINGVNILLRKNLPALAQRVLTVQGLGEAPRTVKELNALVENIDRQLSEMSGLPKSTEMDFSDDSEFGFTDFESVVERIDVY